jgi:hypothetical protein
MSALTLVLIYFSAFSGIDAELERWNLPVLPSNAPKKFLDNVTNTKLIPRDLWVAVSNKSDEMSYQMQPMFERNPAWRVHIEGNPEKDEFMNKVFANTSLLWAYDMINPLCGAAKADIWRYAVLWTYGGAYIDDDSDIKRPFDQMVEPLDEMIITYERNGYNGDTCYLPQYHLSDLSMFGARGKGITKGENGGEKRKVAFRGRTVPNWAMFSAPRHRILERTMHNIVEIIRSDYQMNPYVRSFKEAYTWNLVMCSTGPAVFTGSAREVFFEDPTVKVKLANTDFKDYGGKFKAVSTRPSEVKGHYMNMGRGSKAAVGLLKDYAKEEPLSPAQLQALEQKAVQGHNGKQIFVIEGGKKRGIPNWDTFVSLGYSLNDVIVLTDFKMTRVEIGEEIPPCSKC